MSTASRGIRSIDERVIRDGRALIVTSEEASDYDFKSLPDGTLHVDPETGVISVKIKGETSWSPSTLVFDKAEVDTTSKIVNVQNPTLVIARDSQFNEEKFVIGEVSDTSFIYYRDTKDGYQGVGGIDSKKGFIFDIKDGEYCLSRNHLEVFVNGTNRYSVESGEVSEITEERFGLNVDLKENDEVCVRYIRWARIGSPYPRIYLTQGASPENPNVGDFWLDLNTSFKTFIKDTNNNIIESTITSPAFKYCTEDELGNITWEIVYGDYLDSFKDTVKNITDNLDADIFSDELVSAIQAVFTNDTDVAAKTDAIASTNKVRVEVVEKNGKVEDVNVTTTDIASAARLDQEIKERKNSIAALDSTVASTDLGTAAAATYSDGTTTSNATEASTKVKAQITETDGKLTEVTITTTDIASAAKLDQEVQERKNAINALDSSTSINLDSSDNLTSGNKIGLRVTQTDGKLTGVVLKTNDIASATDLGSSTAEAGTGSAFARIKTLEAYMSSTDKGSTAVTSSDADGYYSWYGTINDVTGNWRILKACDIYEANLKSDPRVYFISIDGSNWYSPYGSWHV